MTAAVAPTTWLAVGYGFFLLLAAHGVDRMARRTAERTARWHSGAFVYHQDHDAWVCPQDQWLWPRAFDPQNRVMRYRASPTVCNACPVKHSCTSSPDGREVTRAVDPWPGSEAERFHRGLACTVAVLALVWPVGTALTGVASTELLVLAATIGIIALGSLPLWSHLRRSPAGFPDHVRSESPEETAAARAVEHARQVRQRSGYGSDRRALPPRGVGDAAAPAPSPVPLAPPVARDRFATRWGAFESASPDDDLPGGWSRRDRS